MSRPPEDKLPLPGPWQAPVRRAIADLTARLGQPEAAVAATRVAEVEWWPETAAGTPPGPRRGLEVWLLAGGRTYRYRVELTGGAPIALG
jgi:hypothetical protein